MDLMENFIKSLMKTFESNTKNKKDKYNEFLYYCYTCFDKNKKFKKRINKYDILRQDLINYLIANEKEITIQLSK